MVYLKEQNNLLNAVASKTSFLEVYSCLSGILSGWRAKCAVERISSRSTGYESLRWSWVALNFKDKFQSQREFQSYMSFYNAVATDNAGDDGDDAERGVEHDTLGASGCARMYKQYEQYCNEHVVFTTPALNHATVAHANAAISRLYLQRKPAEWRCVATDLDAL